MLLVLAISLPAQDTAANDAYIKAMTTNDMAQRAQLLKDWINKYGSGHEYENFANATLATMQYTGKTPDDAIKYGEKAIALGGLDDSTTCQVLLTVSMMYTHKGENLAKAKTYAGRLVQTAQTAKGKESEKGNEKVWNQLIGAGYFAQAQAMEKGNELKAAVGAYINSYNILKNKQIVTTIAKLGQSLYEAKAYADAEKAFAIAVPVLKDFGTTTLYAKALHRQNKKTEALKYYKESYKSRKTGETAYNIGLLLAPQAQSNATVANEAIQYLLDASFLSPANSEKAMKLAEGLYFNQNPEYNEKVKALLAKGEELETTTNSFNEKYGDKTEEDLSDAEKKEMDTMLARIDSLQKEIATLQEEQQASLDKFTSLIEQTKQNLGLK
jgi:polyhydroxyalkanoate synthesis regulator phasin